MTDLQKEQIRAMRLQGLGYMKIGETLGISDNTVRSFCRRNGLGDAAKNTVPCQQCGKLIKIVPKRKLIAILKNIKNKIASLKAIYASF